MSTSSSDRTFALALCRCVGRRIDLRILALQGMAGAAGCQCTVGSVVQVVAALACVDALLSLRMSQAPTFRCTPHSCRCLHTAC